MLKAVIFDFGGVLAFNPRPEQFAEQAASVGMPAVDFEREFWRHRLPYDRGDHDARSYWRAVTGRTFTDEEIQPIVERDKAFWGVLDDRAMNLLRAFRAAGLRTAILSNLPPDLGCELRRRPDFLDHFDQVTFSFEIRAVKPEPAIYRHCLDGLRVAPEEAMFIDDREENVKGAAGLGIHTVLWR